MNTAPNLIKSQRFSFECHPALSGSDTSIDGDNHADKPGSYCPSSALS